MDVLITLSPINIVQAAADFVWSKVPQKFPTLKYALSEGGIGWIPYFRERIDYTYDRHRFWTGQDMGDRLPSQVFDEQVICCWIDDPVGVEMRHKMNVDMITWECDYPHSDSTWPQSPEQFVEADAGRARLRRGHRQDHARERDAAVQLRPVRGARRPRATAPSARCGRRPKVGT